jgi:putative hydrolase of the HAD superfamily
MAIAPPTLVLFDLDNVLCRYERRALAASLAECAGCTPEQVYRSIWSSGLDARSDRGDLDPAAYLAAVSLALRHEITRAQWVAARRRSMTPDHGVLEIVARLKQQCAVAVLTNNSTMVAEHLADICPDVARELGAAVHTSASLGAVKPQADAYLLCAGRLGVAPGDILFVDDLPANVEGAVAAGLRGAIFTDADSLAEELARQGFDLDREFTRRNQRTPKVRT